MNAKEFLYQYYEIEPDRIKDEGDLAIAEMIFDDVRDGDIDDMCNSMEEYAKYKNKILSDFLLEIEAWLSFNQTPNSENTNALREDIKKLLNI